MCLNGVNCGFSRKRCFVAYETHNVRFNTSDYPDGTYTISAEAVDLANNTGFDNISVLVDNTLPVVNVTSPLNGSFVKGTVAINADILEANTASIYVAVD
ncbi:MAG: Ig-like domain-containing protein, partial [bacterium]|nr:Ig-like domain-containing protein [bacterium]